jgi:acyl-CoA synthetase (AMP-forming)/AMP-acid ligase II
MAVSDPDGNRLRIRAFRSGAPSVAWLLGAQSLPSHIDADSPAVRWADVTVTYAELRNRALRLAGGLRAHGLKPGDRIATFLLNRGETFDLYFACAFAGVTLVPVNFRFTAAEVAQVLVDCGAKWLFSEEDLAPVAAEAAESAALSRVTILDRTGPGASYEDLLNTEPFGGPYQTCDPHLILFSSGTTGQPKGAMIRHEAILWYAMQQALVYPDYGPQMRLLITGPLFNTGGINDLTIATFASGGAVAILPSRNWTAQKMGEHIDKWSITHAIVFPSMMEPMLRSDLDGPRLECGSLRLVVTGGEVCPVNTVSRFRQRWRDAVLAIAYGSTELGLATVIIGDEIDAHPESVGRAVSGSAVLIVDPDGKELAPGDVGEIWMAGGSAFSGYLNAPELTDATLRDRWVVSGDLGHVDDRGYLYLDGRSKDLIISGGQNIFPAEIEHVLSGYEDLSDFSVIGVPDSRWGEAVCAVVVQAPGRNVNAEDVIAFVEARIGSYKKPKHVVFVDRLPRSASGKVVKREVRDLVKTSGYEGPELDWKIGT